MDPLARKVVERYANQRIAERIVNKEEIRKRIEAIPGWQRSNFLQSLYRQVERFPLSDKQVAILDKIEKEQAARPKAPGSHADVQLNPRKEWLETTQIQEMIGHLRKKSPVTVYDPRGLVEPNQKLHGHMVNELATDFYGGAEEHAERNADEDDSKKREYNSVMQEKYERAAREMDHAKLHVKQDGPMTTLTLTPSYQEIEHRNGLH